MLMVMMMIGKGMKGELCEDEGCGGVDVLMVVIVAIVTVVMSVIVVRVGTVVGMVVMLLTLVKPQSLLIHSTSIWALGNGGRPNRDFPSECL